jgi:hypothetical protein
MTNRKKNSMYRRWVTGEIYCNHKQGEDKSMMDVWTNTKPTKMTRYQILGFLSWLWGFIVGFPFVLSSIAAAAVTSLTTTLCVFLVAIILFAWIHLWNVGKENWYFQEIFNSVDYTHHESTYTHIDDRRFFMINDELGLARHNNDLEKITELRHNIKMIYLHGDISQSTKNYIQDSYPYLT